MAESKEGLEIVTVGDINLYMDDRFAGGQVNLFMNNWRSQTANTEGLRTAFSITATLGVTPRLQAGSGKMVWPITDSLTYKKARNLQY